jgi:hypothetical protein
MRRGEDAQLPSPVSLQYWRPGSAFIAFKAGLGSRSETLWKAIRQLLPKFFFNTLKSLTLAPSLGSDICQLIFLVFNELGAQFG